MNTQEKKEEHVDGDEGTEENIHSHRRNIKVTMMMMTMMIMSMTI